MIAARTPGLTARTFSSAIADEVWRRVVEPTLPDEVAITAVERVLDALAVTFDALNAPVAVLTRSTLSVGSSDACTVIGFPGCRYSAADAAFANAVTGHCSLREDYGPGGHPGTYVVPSALAAADLVGAGGELVVKALVAGYEAVGLVSEATSPAFRAQGFRLVPVIGVFGAAVAAGVALGLDARALSVAFGLAADRRCNAVWPHILRYCLTIS